MLEPVKRAAKDQERPFLRDELDCRGEWAGQRRPFERIHLRRTRFCRHKPFTPLTNLIQAYFCSQKQFLLRLPERTRNSSRLHNGGASPHLRTVLRQYELVEKVRSYDPDADEGLINRAYVFSMKAHGD